jgi:hypothetical protein
MENGKLPAFANKPYAELPEDVKDNFAGWDGFNFTGLTKREYFAGLALQGLCANPNPNLTKEGMNGAADWYANCAIQFADQLLKSME